MLLHFGANEIGLTVLIRVKHWMGWVGGGLVVPIIELSPTP